MNGLTCLMENCSWDSSKACCTNKTLQKDCGQDYKCLYGEGHCNNDNDCQDGLKCTANSCKWYIPNPPENRTLRANCCDNVTGLIFSV